MANTERDALAKSQHFPDRYIRHSNCLLRRYPITTGAGRAGATFRVTA